MRDRRRLGGPARRTSARSCATTTGPRGAATAARATPQEQVVTVHDAVDRAIRATQRHAAGRPQARRHPGREPGRAGRRRSLRDWAEQDRAQPPHRQGAASSRSRHRSAEAFASLVPPVTALASVGGRKGARRSSRSRRSIRRSRDALTQPQLPPPAGGSSREADPDDRDRVPAARPPPASSRVSTFSPHSSGAAATGRPRPGTTGATGATGATGGATAATTGAPGATTAAPPRARRHHDEHERLDPDRDRGPARDRLHRARRPLGRRSASASGAASAR